MRHVFVETNFIVELARPFPGADAKRLYERADVVLHVPWVSVAESKRTLDRIIREDLGFAGSLRSFAGREFRESRLSVADKAVVDRLADRVTEMHGNALREVVRNVDTAVARMQVIEPSRSAVEKVLSLYNIKSLPPFDEMAMGAVLVKAEELLASGERGFYFCNLNKRDFDPSGRPTLAAEYERLTITYLPSFNVPD